MNNILDFEIWEKSIGEIILSCARVEYEMFRLYKLWIPDRNFHDDVYENRYDKAIGVAKEKLGESHSMINQLIKMKKTAKYRHMIAHNPIHFSNEYDDWRIFDLKTNTDSLGLLDLKKIAHEAEMNSIELSTNLRINVS